MISSINEWQIPFDIVNFRCLSLKADFRFFYFELETLLNKLAKLCSYFFKKRISNKNAECFIFINLFSNRPQSGQTHSV